MDRGLLAEHDNVNYTTQLEEGGELAEAVEQER